MVNISRRSVIEISVEIQTSFFLDNFENYFITYQGAFISEVRRMTVFELYNICRLLTPIEW